MRSVIVGVALLVSVSFAHAGPPCVAWYARPTEEPHDLGYYVGGGAWRGGECRRGREGTWGWDYGGCLVPKRVILAWYHGRRCQGGIGSYKTVGTTKENHSSP